ncbi:Type IV secretion-system coupling protein DNA-binding domain protein [Gimesia alba]|uniref:Type IV secretion-system coupling protein DNA-binding domain protein n=1 Tax=Gimesia alba TaxID=2527973 RepID=A0A517RMS1_9PLAN|nr:FtsK/SpoIIIE domain-containing protein [Gimesia alba]QDT45180.1 Type IV secretion-system coupling protein DNA-binding domain protein [Gimesia alba]
MIPIQLGVDRLTDSQINIEPDQFRTHFHLIGATGSGKSTAIQTLLRPILMQPRSEMCALFLIDPMGNLSRDLLGWMANERICPQHVRDRLVYIEPAREDIIMPFNPLSHTSEANRYYQTMRSVDIVLRAWAAQDVSQQPRLLQWTYKAFCAAAMMGLPIAMCKHLLHPGSPEHEAILNRIPGDIRFHWNDILGARGSEAVRILESTRNRLDPFFESTNLRRMFGCTRSLFDCERFIKERRIVILNLGKYGRLPGFVADTIGALALNEIVETASRLSTNAGKQAVDPTYVVMDEFQKYVSVDIEDALPTVRQMGLRLILAHQSFAQLDREDVDLTQMIWQARSRLMFANNARDADIIADELTKLTYESRKIKDILKSKKQLIIGYRKEWLETESSTSTRSTSNMEQNSTGYSQSSGESIPPETYRPTKSKKDGRNSSTSKGHTHADSTGNTSGRSESNVPIHDTFEEISNITYESFEEQSLQWGKQIRGLQTGEAFGMFAGDPDVHFVNVDYLPIYDSPQLREAVDALIEKNFESDFFISASEADREIEQYRKQLLQVPPIQLSDQDYQVKPEVTSDDPEKSSDPFR